MKNPLLTFLENLFQLAETDQMLRMEIKRFCGEFDVDYDVFPKSGPKALFDFLSESIYNRGYDDGYERAVADVCWI